MPASPHPWRNVISLSFAQALFQTGSVLVMTLAGMVGLELAADKDLSTLPIAMIAVGSAIMLIPASIFFRKYGQKNGFIVGTCIGVCTGILAFYAIISRSFGLFLVSNILVGCYQGFAQYYRFAAADSVTDAAKGKAISFVMAGGVVAAVAGPNLARFTQDLGSVHYAWSFLSISILSAVALLVISTLSLPLPAKVSAAPGQTTSGRPLREIIRQRSIIAALTASAAGYAVMVMVMTATPLAMHNHGHSHDASANVIQWHVLGMFVPSFFTGFLIGKFGVKTIVLSGILLLFIHLALVLTGTDFMHFVSGLIFLGIGWNFMFIGGTTMLTKAYRPEEKEKTQALHDFLVAIVLSASGFAAGSILNHWGWTGVNLAAIPLLLLALFVIAWPSVLSGVGKAQKQRGNDIAKA